ncbi:MAG: SDR family NAD(P)-dependent oxidoreductase [Gammaproteobacteria bacterium]|nr:SDR family NAD(P)-dependent oxidoreductase [Gammaproteobacteria bacterium]
MIKNSPIAVVATASILPGSNTTDQSWTNILDAKDFIREVPVSHWLPEDYYDPDSDEFSKIYTKTGAFISDIPFDPVEFNMPPNTLASTDTNQLLALIAAKRLLNQTKSVTNNKVDLKNIGIILGVAAGSEMQEQMSAKIQKPVWKKVLREHGLAETDVQDICGKIEDHYPDWTENTFPGLLSNVVAGRVANKLNLGGCNFVTDAACASSLSAINMAMLELQSGNADMIISGGVDALSNIFMYMCFTKTPALSRTGDIRPFSNEGDGTILGEGVALFALRRLEDAERDGDTIHAVINSCGSSSDGKFKSIYAPSPEGQSRCINNTYQSLEYGLGDIELVEAHGTGTKAGDAAEFEGLNIAFKNDKSTHKKAKQYCALGTIKSQIGHTKSTAGAAGLLKTIFALQHKVLPPTIKIKKPNDIMNIDDSALYLNTEARPWIKNSNQPRRAAVSSFGFGGSNFHITVEEYTGNAHSAKRIYTKLEQQEISVHLSAENSSALNNKLQKLKTELDSDKTTLLGIARRSHLATNNTDRSRLSFVAASKQQLASLIQALEKQNVIENNSDFSMPGAVFLRQNNKPGKTALLFAGQGSQYLNMGRELLNQFDQARMAWDSSFTLNIDPQKTLHQVVFPIPVFNDQDRETQNTELSQIKWIQPALGALSLSHLNMLKTLDIKADVYAGHSYGELPALFAAGVIPGADDLLKISQKRAELMQKAVLEPHNQSHPGGMTAVFESPENIQTLLDKNPGNISIANLNSPAQTVISGCLKDIQLFEDQLTSQAISFKRLNVPTAFHSPWVASAEKEFASYLKSKSFNTMSLPVYSNLTGELYPASSSAIKKELSAQLSSPVQFLSELEKMKADGVTTFIEIGPGKTLSQLVKASLGDEVDSVSLDLGPRTDSVSAFWRATAELSALGINMNLAKIWEEFAEEEIAPRKEDGSKATIIINGANFGKPYPPKEGARALPKANLTSTLTDNRSTQQAHHTMSNTPKNPATPQQTVQTTAHEHMQKTDETSAIKHGQPLSTANNPATAYNSSNEMLSTIKSIQDTAFRAQQAFQNTLAQSHQSYLQSTQAILTSLLSTPEQVSALPASFRPAPDIAGIQTQPAVSSAIAETITAKPIFETSAVNTEPKPVFEAQPGNETPANDFVALVLNIVSDKTGYPEEMLELDLDMESGLGIDSIKRVEILSALQDEIPALKGVDTAKLAAMNTLAEILAFSNEVSESASSNTNIAAVNTRASQGSQSPASSVENFKPLLLEIVAEKTGYPEEMLELDLDMESGLGIDSIKRVEILSALQDKIPALKDVDTAKLAAMNTLGEILHFSENSTPTSIPMHITEPAADTSPQNEMIITPAEDFRPLLLEIVAEKTGYPEEMLELDLDMESGLGIDSIKRVEILSALQDKIPALKDVDTAKLAAMNTLAEILDFSNQATQPNQAIVEESSDTSKQSPSKKKAFRCPVLKVEKPLCGFAMQGLRSESPVIIVKDDSGIANELQKLFNNAGINCELQTWQQCCSTKPERIIYLEALNQHCDNWQEINFRGFQLAQNTPQHASDDNGLFVCVHNSRASLSQSYSSGLSALIKTADKEWTGYGIKSIDLQAPDDAALTNTESAQLIFQEMMAGGFEIEVAYNSDQQRFTYESPVIELPATHSFDSVNKGDVWLVSGGLKGVTADCLVQISKNTPLKLAILGRSEINEESALTKNIVNDAELKKALLDEAKKQGKKITPKQLKQQASIIYSTREMTRNLHRLQSAGSTVDYFSCDIGDYEAVKHTLNHVRNQIGPIKGVVHGAGILADKLIREKTEEQFRGVFNTKVKGFKNLLELTTDDPLSVLCCFSSVASRTGNVGQVDYAMANEVLNKICQLEHKRRNETGTGCVVKSINWGPWDGGMVTPELKIHFESQGIKLLDIDAGAQAFVDELLCGPDNSVEVVIGGGALDNWSKNKSLNISTVDLFLHQEFQPWLSSHVIKEQTVVPAMMVSEWFLRIANIIINSPVSLRTFSVNKGMILDNFNSTGNWYRLHIEFKDEVLSFVLQSESGVTHYSCLAEKNIELPYLSMPDKAEPAQSWNIKQIYPRCLFHGPDFQVIEKLEQFSEASAYAVLKHALPFSGPQQTWKSDLTLLDGGIQLAILWLMEQIDKDSLPTGFKSLHINPQYSGQLINQDINAVFIIASHDTFKASGDLIFSLPNGDIICLIQSLDITTGTSDLIYREKAGLN